MYTVYTGQCSKPIQKNHPPLPRTQARSSGFESDWDFGPALGIIGKAKRRTRRLIFLVHPSQRALRPRLTFPCSIARYSLMARAVAFFHS